MRTFCKSKGSSFAAKNDPEKISSQHLIAAGQSPTFLKLLPISG
jgi:hypothetical protein